MEQRPGNLTQRNYNTPAVVISMNCSKAIEIKDYKKLQ